jgi:beta-glucosidase
VERKKIFMLIGILLLAFGLVNCDGSSSSITSDDTIIDPRVEETLAKMTLDEKVGQMLQVERRETPSWLNEDGEDIELDPKDIQTYFLGSVLSGGGSTPGDNTIEDWKELVTKLQKSALKTRLGIPILYGIDAVHGHSNVYGATIMPHNIGLGATRDPDLVRRVSEVAAREVVATSIPWTFSPCVAVSRDERWGRSYESVGEDPEIATLLSAQAVEGFQGETMNGQSVIATAKHYLGDGGTRFGTGSHDVAQGGDRLQFMDRGDTSSEMLEEIHLAGFTKAVEAGVGSVMISFSSVDGVSMHANKELIQGLLKEEMGFDGFTISDWDGIKEIDLEGAEDLDDEELFKAQVIASVDAGIDMFMIPFKQDWSRFITIVKDAVEDNIISMERIDDAVRRILTIKYRSGIFEKPYGDEEFQSEEFLGSPEHREVAREAVRKSLVLLRNNNEALPLTAEQNILVTGKNAHNIGHQCGGWTLTWQGGSDIVITENEDGTETRTREKFTEGTTILEGIEAYVENHRDSDSETGYVDFMAEDDPDLPEGDLHYDVAVAVLGETPYAEWFGDRYSEELVLDDEDLEVLDVLYDAQEDGRVDKIVVVLVSGRPLVVTEEIKKWDGFVAAWLPGSEGQGVADVLFNEYDFVGKLPVTWPRRIDLIPINRGEDYKEALFTYGYGMSYPEPEEEEADVEEESGDEA